MDFDSIPSELKEYNQWVCWKYEDRGKKKKDKVPYCALDGTLASVNNVYSWTSFENCKEFSFKFDGIGFMLSISDPFCFIDFDDPFELDITGKYRYENPQQILDRQLELHAEFDSYSEKSPSGKGLHIVCKGNIPSGRRRNGIEIYPNARFMTVTGEVYNDKPIKFSQSHCSKLWEDLQGTDPNLQFESFNVKSDHTDRQIYDMAVNATNGQKFIDLWNGDIHKYHGGDHSRADFALVDIIAFYTQDREQIERLFKTSALGKRPKANRPSYMQTMITRAFDKIIPHIDLSNITNQVNDFLANNKHINIKDTSKDRVSLRDDFNNNVQIIKQHNNNDSGNNNDDVFAIPPGLTGEIAKFIYQQAPKPVKEIATVGALAYMAGLCGKAYNVSGSGLNLYMLLLAKTGRGKEAISKGVENLTKSMINIMPQMQEFIGPSDLASGQGLLRYISDHPTRSFVSIMGEFGIRLKSICSSNALGSDIMLQKVLLDMYSKSGASGVILPTAYSDAERNTQTIYSPAFSLLGESAPDWFYDNVNDEMIRSGLLPRFTIIHYSGKRVPTNENFMNVKPSQELIQNVCATATAALKMIQSNAVYNVKLDEFAQIRSKQLDQMCDNKINACSDENMVAELWNRCHLKTMRVAALLAVGMNPYKPVIDNICWEWAENFVVHGVKTLEEHFTGTEVVSVSGSNEALHVEILQKVIVEYLASDYSNIANYTNSLLLHQQRIIPYVYLHKKCARKRQFMNDKIGSTNAIKRALLNLIDNGDLIEINKQQAIKDLDYNGRCFAIKSTRMLEKAKKLNLKCRA